MTTRIAINGFGRMGRAACRIVHNRDLGLELVAVNELGPVNSMAKLLARDSVHGPFGAEVTAVEGGIEIDRKLVRFYAQPIPRSCPGISSASTW